MHRPSRLPGRLAFAGLAFAGLAIVLSGCLGHATKIEGRGATFPAPVYARWIALFNRAHSDLEVEYAAMGSGAGIEGITQRQVHFGASDALPNEQELEAMPGEILAIPTVAGAVVLAYNLPDLEGRLILSGPLVADIYLGRIERWNDPRLTALNPGLNLPADPIYVAHRSDSSGTTYIFTDYLSAVSPDWERQLGRAKALAWPTGDDWAGDGNDGVAQRILLRRGGIGYLEVKYALNAGLEHASLVNREGQVVEASVDSVQPAERNTPPPAEGFVKPSIVDAPGADSYPIAGFTYLLVYLDLRYLEDPAVQVGLVQFLRWTLTEGQSSAEALGYTPLPEPLRLRALAEVDRIVVDAGDSAH